MSSTRREILAALLGAPAALAASCRKTPSLDVDGSLVDPSLRFGHQLRGELPPPREVIPKTARVVVLGGGVAGLTAAWALRRAKVSDVVVLELEPTPGGTAVGAPGPFGGYPWGAHYLPAPSLDQPELVALLEEMGAVTGRGERGQPAYAEHVLAAEPQERMFADGEWRPGLFPGIAPGGDGEVARFSARMQAFARTRGADGRPAFTLPVAASSEDPALLALDDLDFAAWLERERFVGPDVRWLVDYATRDDFGARPDQTSAWFGVHYHAARLDPESNRSAPFLTWPDGNFRIVRHLAQSAPVLPERLVTRVAEEAGRVLVCARRPDGTEERWRADAAVVALPSFVRARVVEEHREDVPETSAWLVANLHLARRPRGPEAAWDNVLRDSRSLGYVVATHQRGPPVGPTVWTWYLPRVDADPAAARRDLLALDWRQAADLVLSDLEAAHPDLRACATRVDVRRWGHAMAIPSPGARRRAPPAARGPIAFAHADLSGVGLFEEAFSHGLAAAAHVAARVSR